MPARTHSPRSRRRPALVAATAALTLWSSLSLAFGAPSAPAAAAGPQTVIFLGPNDFATTPQPTFQFSSGDRAATFECSVDGQAWAPCATPYKVGTPLRLGRHYLRVRAVDAAGRRDRTPAVRRWIRIAGIGKPVITVPRLAARRALRIATLARIRGRAVTKAGIASVEAGLFVGAPTGSPQLCRWIDWASGRVARGRLCFQPIYRTARGTSRWTLALPRAVRAVLRPGVRYTLQVRAINRLGDATITRFAFRVRR